MAVQGGRALVWKPITVAKSQVRLWRLPEKTARLSVTVTTPLSMADGSSSVPVRRPGEPGHLEGEAGVPAHEVTGQAPGFHQPDAGQDEQGVLTLEELEREGGHLGVGGPGEGLGPGHEGRDPVPFRLPGRHLGRLATVPSFVSQSHFSSLIGPAHATQSGRAVSPRPGSGQE